MEKVGKEEVEMSGKLNKTIPKTRRPRTRPSRSQMADYYTVLASIVSRAGLDLYKTVVRKGPSSQTLTCLPLSSQERKEVL